MDLKITEKKKNALLKRQEITAEIKEKTIPSRKVLRDKLAALLNAKEDTIVITQVKSKFGSPAAKVYAHAYETAEELKKLEVQYIKDRNFGKEKKETAQGPGSASGKLQEINAFER